MATRASIFIPVPPCHRLPMLLIFPWYFGAKELVTDTGVPMRKLGLSLIAVVCVFMVSCGGSHSRELLIGKWKGKNQGATVDSIVEFTKDGKVKKEAIGVESVSTGTYQWVDNDKIEIRLTMPAGKTITEQSKVNIDKQTMTLTNPQGSVGKYTREN